MSVMAETSQLAMEPYVAMAAVGLVLYAWTAVFREALVVKVATCGAGLKVSGSTLAYTTRRGERGQQECRPGGDTSACKAVQWSLHPYFSQVSVLW